MWIYNDRQRKAPVNASHSETIRRCPALIQTMALEARHALWDHNLHRPYSGRGLWPPRLAVGAIGGRAAEAGRKGVQEASNFQLEINWTLWRPR